MASAAAVPSCVSQNGLRIKPDHADDGEHEDREEEVESRERLVDVHRCDAASRLPPCGVIARSSAPPTPSSSLTRPRRTMFTTSEITMNTNGMLGITAAVNLLSVGR